MSGLSTETLDAISAALKLGVAGEDPTYAILDEEGKALTQAPANAIEWCIGRTWCNSPDLFTFARSYQMIRDYFELRCPLCNPGNTEPGQPGDCMPGNRARSRMYLEGEVLLVWNPEYQEDVCPKCHVTKSELIEDGLAHGYNQLHLVAGMRSGKTMTAALIGTYAEARFYQIAHGTPGGIHGYLGITKAELYEICFLASTDVQSEYTIWSKYAGFRNNSPWFRRYVQWIQKQVKLQPDIGMRKWRYKEDTKRILNEHPSVRLMIVSLNSNSGGQAGRTRVHGFVDELARMKNTESAMGAQEVYRTIESGLRTMRSRVKRIGGLPWFGSMVSVTSPIARDDQAMKLLRKAPEIPDMYAKKYSTWEFNPLEPRSNFTSDFIKDPIGAERDFGANPPGSQYPLIHDEARWRELSVHTDLAPVIQFETFERADGVGHEYVAIKLVHAKMQFDGRQRYIVWDAGQNFDAFAGCCAHGERFTEKDGTERLVTVYDWFVRILPTVGTEVFFDSVTDVMRQLRQYIPIARVEFDRWNSVQIIQQVRDMGIVAEQMSLNNQDWVDWKVACFMGNVAMLPPAEDEYRLENGKYVWRVDPPYLGAAGAAVYELTGLQCDPDTHKVSNPRKGEKQGWNSNDCAQVAVHAHKLVQMQGYTERHDDRTRRAARRRLEGGQATWGQDRGQIRPGQPAAAPRQWGKGRGW